MCLGIVELDHCRYAADEGAIGGHAAVDRTSEEGHQALGARIPSDTVALGRDPAHDHPRVGIEKEGDPRAEHFEFPSEASLKADVRFGVIEQHAVEPASAAPLEVEALRESSLHPFGDRGMLDRT